MTSQQPKPKPNQTKTTCHCKSLTLTFPPLRAPALECLCSICRRYGALWAYYSPSEVQIKTQDRTHTDDNTTTTNDNNNNDNNDDNATIESYTWGKNKTLKFNRCKKCGCMTHYTVIKGADTQDRVAVNCRMLEREEFDELDRVESDGE